MGSVGASAAPEGSHDMARNAISAAVIGTALTLGLVATGATADQPDPAGQVVQSKTAVRSQVQAQEPAGCGSPLAVAGAEVGRQNTRQLGPGDGSGAQAGRSDDAVAQGTAARRGNGDGTADTGATRSHQSKRAKRSKTAKPSAVGATQPRSTTGQRLQLRDPSSGCSGMPTSTQSQSSSGHRRGGGGRR